MWSRSQVAVDEVVLPTIQPYVYRAVLDAMGEEADQKRRKGDQPGPESQCWPASRS